MGRDAEIAMTAWEATIRRDHTCTCVTCDPDVRVDGARQGPQHIGVRFWGDYPGERHQDRDAIILLDGVEIGGVYEAILGDEGVVWVFRSVPWTDTDGTARDNGYHPCLTCRDAADREGRLSPDGYLLRPLPDGTEEQVSLGVCSMKLVGRVELRRPAAIPADAE